MASDVGKTQRMEKEKEKKNNPRQDVAIFFRQQLFFSQAFVLMNLLIFPRSNWVIAWHYSMKRRVKEKTSIFRAWPHIHFKELNKQITTTLEYAASLFEHFSTFGIACTRRFLAFFQ